MWIVYGLYTGLLVTPLSKPARPITALHVGGWGMGGGYLSSARSGGGAMLGYPTSYEHLGKKSSAKKMTKKIDKFF